MGEINELLAQVQKNDLVALEQLIVQVSPQIEALYRSQMKAFPNHFELEDCLQEFWIRVWDNRKHYDPKKGNSAWLHSIARNLLIDWVRKQKWSTEELEEAISTQSSAQQTLLGKEMSQRCIDVLPEKQKLVFILCMQMGLSPKEASEIAGMNRSTLRNQLTHVRKKLKKVMLEMGFQRSEP